jgi:Flp pilus assembly protein TadB
MPRRAKPIAVLLVCVFVVSGAGLLGADSASIVSRADMEQALAKNRSREDTARESIKALLRRDEVRRLAEGHGLDVRRAEAAVDTLHGEELQRLAEQASLADARLAGGDNITINISLIALLLIIIIIILLVK